MTYNMLEFKEETDIQNKIRYFLEKEKFSSIISEDYLGHYPDLQKHQYILMDLFVSKIELLNKHIWENDLYKKNKEDIIEIIKNDFIHKFDNCSTNQEIHNLIFGRNIRTISLLKKNGDNDPYVSYRVLDTDYSKDCRNNEITVIKEKVIRVNVYSTETQRPDFAVYLNGIPFIAVEVKNPLSTIGIYEAYKDYKNKITYHKFISCLCTDGINAAITADPNGLTPDIWKSYGENEILKYKEYNNGLFDFLDEIVFNIRNFVFFFQYCTFPLNKNLGVLRVQQYYYTKKYDILLSHNKNFREVVNHPARSGKTIAIRSAINLTISKYPDRFNKIFIQTPDLTILEQFIKDFSSYNFINGFSVKVINRRLRSEYHSSNKNECSYEEALENNQGKHIYIMNMQKNTDELKEISYLNNDVLFFIDEVHTHQLSKNSFLRSINFPNASYMTFTATTRKEKQDEIIIDKTLTEYSTSGKYFDQLYNEEAKKLGIVIPVVYEKAKYEAVLDKDKAKEFSDFVDSETSNRLSNDKKFAPLLEEINEKVNTFVQKMIKDLYGSIVDINEIDINSPFFKYKDKEILEKAYRYKESLINEKTNTIKNNIKKEFIYNVKQEIIPEYINYITSDFNNKIYENYTNIDIDNGNKELLFKPKAFIVVDSQKEAINMANYIKEKSNGTNIINGYKFGIDFSENPKFNDDNLNFIDKFNIISHGNTIKDDFDSQEKDSIDFLIIVGKYLMGYDNKKLVAVYCLTNINEPARMFQLYTRPATKYDNKNIGFFVDLCFDNQNYDTYKNALSWYEDSKNTTLFLDEDNIESQLNSLKSYISKICFTLNLTEDELIRSENERQLFLDIEDESTRQNIFSLCKGINLTIRNLVSPKFYKEYLPHILTINKALWGFINYLKAQNKEAVFTRKDIELLFMDFMQKLNIKNVNEIMEIEIKDGNFIKKIDSTPTKETIISKQLYKVKNLLDSTKDYMKTDIYNKLKMMAENIEADNKWNEDTVAETEKMIEESKKEMSSIKNKIINEFNNNQEWFITYSILYNFMNSVIEKINNKTLMVYSERLSSKIVDHIYLNSKNGILELDDKIREKTRLSFSDVIISLYDDFSSENTESIQVIYEMIGTDEVKNEAFKLSNLLIEEVYRKKYDFK